MDAARRHRKARHANRLPCAGIFRRGFPDARSLGQRRSRLFGDSLHLRGPIPGVGPPALLAGPRPHLRRKRVGVVANGLLRERIVGPAGVDRTVDRHGQHVPRSSRRLPAQHRPTRQARRLGTGIYLRAELVQTLRERARHKPGLRHGTGPNRLRTALSLYDRGHRRIPCRHTATNDRTRRHPRRRLVRSVDRMGHRLDELRPAPPAGAVRLQPSGRHADFGACRSDMAGCDGTDRREHCLPGRSLRRPPGDSAVGHERLCGVAGCRGIPRTGSQYPARTAVHASRTPRPRSARRQHEANHGTRRRTPLYVRFRGESDRLVPAATAKRRARHTNPP